MIARLLLLVLSLGCCPGHAVAAELRVAVAANFRDAFDMLSDLYEQQGGSRPEGIYGSSSMLYAQISQGAPFALFLSADRDRPARLVVAGRTAGEVQIYARGRLALWMPGRAATPDALQGGRFAMANPQLAPYGAAARACLEHLALWGENADNAVYGTNVSQAFQFVAARAVPAGFVSYAQLLVQNVPAAEIWLAPPDCHPPIDQGAVVLKGEREAQAAAFLAFLLSEPAQQRLEAMGYIRP